MALVIGIVLFDGAEELDFVGPWEVFTLAARLRSDVRVVSIAAETQPVRCAKGLRVLPDHDFANAPELDVLVVPGGQGTRVVADDETFIKWLRSAGEHCAWVTSVCTGSLLLHRSGFAEGRKITTHWAFVENLRKLAPDATVVADVRYVRDGRLVTAAGVSAGIDMALWLVGELWGEDHARETQRAMQYDPEPPYSS